MRADYFVNQPTRIVRFANSADWTRLYNEAQWNTAGNPARSFWGQPGNFTPLYSDEIIRNYETGIDPDLYPCTDWMDLLKSAAHNQRLALNFRGGGEKLRFLWLRPISMKKGCSNLIRLMQRSFNVRLNMKLILGLRDIISARMLIWISLPGQN